MECKFCGTKLDADVTVCPECGLAVEPETVKKKSNKKTIVLAVVAVIAVLVLLVSLVGTILFTVGILSFTDVFSSDKKENDVFYHETYTVDEKTYNRKENTVIAKVGDEKLDNGLFQFYYIMNVMDFLNNNSYYLSYMGLDPTLPLDEQFANEDENITWQQLFIDNALADWYNYTLMNLLAEEEGYTVSSEMQTTIDTFEEELQEIAVNNGFMDAQSMITSDFGAGYDVEDYISYLENRYKAVDYVSHLYQQLEPTAEELDAYFAENEQALGEKGITKDMGYYGNVRHILIQPKGGQTDEDGVTVYSAEEWTACQTEAQGILDQWLAGEANEQTFAQLANEYSEDPGSNTTGGLYTMVQEGQMVEEFDYWLFFEEHEYGDYGLVKTTYGYHLMFFVGLDEIWEVETKDQMITAKIEEKSNAAEEKWPIEKFYKKIVLNELKLT